MQTYLERDIRAVTAIRDLGTFRRFLALLASRAGSILNKTDLAAPLGVSVPTITEWLNALEVTGQINPAGDGPGSAIRWPRWPRPLPMEILRTL